MDEAYLANNIITHSLRFLITNPLDADQAAPMGFLFCLKFMGKLFNYQDIYLRLVPLLFSFGLLLIAYGIKNKFNHKITQYLFVGLLAFSPVLIYYSSEIKQYILDTSISALLLLVGLNYQKWRYGYLILIISGSLAILTSFASVFVLAAVGITATLVALHHKDKGALIRLVGIGFSWLIIFGLNYFLSLRYVIISSPLKDMWADTFAPIPNSMANLKWYLDSLLGLASLGFSKPAPLPINSLASWYAPVNWVILAGILAGMYFLYHHDRKWFLINSLVILFTLIGSFFKLYPFRSRPILFLVPILFSFLCALVDGLLYSPIRLLKIILESFRSFLLFSRMHTRN